MATSGGNITSDGGATVTARGVCWNTTHNPYITGNHTIDGTGTGSFVSNITGLTGGSLYYVRAYASNSVGTSYGNEVSFTTVALPTVITDTTLNITQTTATSGGNVTMDGGSTVTARGVCWSVSSPPTIANNHTTDGSGTGGFVSYVTGMIANTHYYIRAYATNVYGTVYGNQRNFMTLKSTLPTVTTNAVTNIKTSTAICGGDVTSDGGAAVTSRGVCWSTSQNPTISNSHTNDGSGSGKFTSYITSLKSHTWYYVRAYAININGISYGNLQTFMTLWLGTNGGDSDDTIHSDLHLITLNLYPNPVRSKLTIEFVLDDISNINLSVYNVSGTKIYNEQLYNQPSGSQMIQLSTSPFVEGLYIVVVTTNETSATSRFIKIN
jgi:hypothetical protein